MDRLTDRPTNNLAPAPSTNRFPMNSGSIPQVKPGFGRPPSVVPRCRYFRYLRYRHHQANPSPVLIVLQKGTPPVDTKFMDRWKTRAAARQPRSCA
jgi:hypothetical protein